MKADFLNLNQALTSEKHLAEQSVFGSDREKHSPEQSAFGSNREKHLPEQSIFDSNRERFCQEATIDKMAYCPSILNSSRYGCNNNNSLAACGIGN